ncbi:hypothetical protein GX51_00552 [Blastomyces parvus]|uniref:Uncharacterized protein n=1 Tax=Blastomyces parvus TaxID=2060905 RepID=A0A2B7XLK9_9EURO|nr:hypothetical protein GX51_00552 [Blastomyces parvus]
MVLQRPLISQSVTGIKYFRTRLRLWLSASNLPSYEKQQDGGSSKIPILLRMPEMPEEEEFGCGRFLGRARIAKEDLVPKSRLRYGQNLPPIERQGAHQSDFELTALLATFCILLFDECIEVSSFSSVERGSLPCYNL